MQLHSCLAALFKNISSTVSYVLLMEMTMGSLISESLIKGKVKIAQIIVAKTNTVAITMRRPKGVMLI